MPLFLRATRDHYPDDTSRDARTKAGFVALTGSYTCGNIAQATEVHSERLLAWNCGFGHFRCGGTVATVEEAKPAMAEAFRGALEGFPTGLNRRDSQRVRGERDLVH
jgi:hypothetical protein